MAIPQAGNAVFYHPLDDSTESLQAQAWTGAASFSAAKVSLGLESAAVLANSAPAIGPQTEFHSAGAVAWVSATALDASKFVVAYNDAADSNRGKARVGTVSGTAITYGPATTFLNAGVATQISITTLSATKFAATYMIRTSLALASIGVVSGVVITFGAEATFLSALGGVSAASAAAVSATAFVVAYGAAFAAQSEARVGTVSGTDITFGSAASFSGAQVTAPKDLSVAALSATAFVVAYADATDSDHGTAKVGTVSGTAIVFGPEAEFLSAGAASKPSATALSSTVFIVAYRDEADSNHGTAKVGAVSGALISFGPEAEFLGANSEDISAAALDASNFVVAYRDVADSGHGTAKVGTVSGTAITFGAEAEFLSSTSATDISATALSASKFVVAYRDTGDSDHGKANAMTTAAYPTAVGATRLAFSAWSRSPHVAVSTTTTVPPTTTSP